MSHFDLFDFFRFMLTVLVTVYSTVRLAHLIWRWQGVRGQMQVGSAIVYRYLIVLLLRARFRRFAYEFTVIGGLAVVLLLLIQQHW